MKKVLFILILMLLASQLAVAQQIVGDSIYISSNSLRFKVGDEIVLGTGSDVYGAFKFVYGNPFWGTGRNSKLPAIFDNLSVVIKRIHKEAATGTAFKYYLVVKTGGYGHFWVDVEEALQNGEVLRQNSTPFKKK